MDTSSATELMTSIDRLVEKNTFSLEALGAINDLRTKALELDSKLKAETTYRERTALELRTSESKNTALRLELDGWSKRETDLKTREDKMIALEKSAAVAEAKLSATVDTVGLFLRNTIVRESVQSNIPVPMSGSGGYVSPQVGSENKTISKE